MNFDVCLIAFVMYLSNGVPFSIFVLTRDYCTPLSLDGFPNAPTLLSLSFELNLLKYSSHIIGTCLRYAKASEKQTGLDLVTKGPIIAKSILYNVHN